MDKGQITAFLFGDVDKALQISLANVQIAGSFEGKTGIKSIGVFFGRIEILNSLIVKDFVSSSVKLVNDDGAVIANCPSG